MPSKPFAMRVDELRDKISSAQAELAALPDQPLPAADALARLNHWITAESAKFNPARAFTTEGSNLNVLELQGLRLSENTVSVDPTPMLCWLLGDTLKAKLTAAIEALPPSTGIPLKDRPAVAQRLRDEIARLETAEERLVREAEAAGEPLERRGDARPEIVLAANL